MSYFRRNVAATLLLAVLFACSASSDRGGGSPQDVVVGIAPPSADLPARGTVRFAATVSGTADTAVVWEVVETGGGTVDASGLYAAPSAPGVFHVRATSRAAPQAHGESTVTVVAPPPPVAVAVSPRTAAVVAGGTVAFSATVTNAADASVDWSVAGATGCGTITPAGVYSAPALAATCTVVATSRADPSRSDAATVTVTAPPPPVVVTVTPSPAAADACTTLAFTATVTGAADSSVTWSLQEGAAAGTITADGVYTAAASAGTYHVVATSRADPSRIVVVPVSVTDRVLAVAVAPQQLELAAGGTVQLVATVTTTCGAFTSTSTVTTPASVVAR